MGILVLVFYNNLALPRDEIIDTNLVSFLHVIRSLGAPYILEHVAKYVVTDYTLTLFRVHDQLCTSTIVSPLEEN